MSIPVLVWFTYSGISLVSWLWVQRRDNKEHSFKTDRQTDRQTETDIQYREEDRRTEGQGQETEATALQADITKNRQSLDDSPREQTWVLSCSNCDDLHSTLQDYVTVYLIIRAEGLLYSSCRNNICWYYAGFECYASHIWGQTFRDVSSLLLASCTAYSDSNRINVRGVWISLHPLGTMRLFKYWLLDWPSVDRM